MGCAPPQRPVLAFASSCCDSKQASSSAALSAHFAGMTGALPAELLMPMQSSIERTAAAPTAVIDPGRFGGRLLMQQKCCQPLCALPSAGQRPLKMHQPAAAVRLAQISCRCTTVTMSAKAPQCASSQTIRRLSEPSVHCHVGITDCAPWPCCPVLAPELPDHSKHRAPSCHKFSVASSFVSSHLSR
jgi:hypothetical protein